MPRSVGLAWASRLYRESPAARSVARGFSRGGEEVCFATIGNAGTSEGVFWESLNAAGVLQIPLVISVWDDGYGISVPNEFQTTKGSISAVLEGFRRQREGTGIELYTVKGHDYVACCDVYQIAAERARREHIPAVIHVTEMTQPQGHSTSGSHERYKSKERLRFEIEFDPIRRMREWLIREEMADATSLDELERASRIDVERIREEAWDAYQAPIHAEREQALTVLLRCFDANLERDPRILILGEDIGKLGDVNLVFEGLQAKHGEQRVIDTGIREATILGQGIGAALRGLRPVVDIQYVDYLLYALELASDDLATLHWRTGGGQKAPVLIRTKGHRLQGIWHTGSPMATIISSLRGLHVAVPRDMTRAAGLYNTLLRGDDPALLIEVLSGYSLKERLPENIGDFTIPLGVTETNRAGSSLP